VIIHRSLSLDTVPLDKMHVTLGARPAVATGRFRLTGWTTYVTADHRLGDVVCDPIVHSLRVGIFGELQQYGRERTQSFRRM